MEKELEPAEDLKKLKNKKKHNPQPVSRHYFLVQVSKN